jgi:hypothetical protein
LINIDIWFIFQKVLKLSAYSPYLEDLSKNNIAGIEKKALKPIPNRYRSIAFDVILKKCFKSLNE